MYTHVNIFKIYTECVCIYIYIINILCKQFFILDVINRDSTSVDQQYKIQVIECKIKPLVVFVLYYKKYIKHIHI